MPARAQQDLQGHRGRVGAPLYLAPGICTPGRACPQKGNATDRCTFATGEEVEINAAWGVDRS